jgi:hypothetical protein
MFGIGAGSDNECFRGQWWFRIGIHIPMGEGGIHGK